MDTLKIKVVADTSSLQRSIQNAANMINQLKTQTTFDIKANVDIQAVRRQMSDMNKELQSSGQGLNLVNVGSNVAQIGAMSDAVSNLGNTFKSFEQIAAEATELIEIDGQVYEINEAQAALETYTSAIYDYQEAVNGPSEMAFGEYVGPSIEQATQNLNSLGLSIEDVNKAMASGDIDKYCKNLIEIQHNAENASKGADKAAKGIKNTGDQSEKAGKKVNSLTKAFNMLKGAMVAIGAVGLVSYGKSAYEMVNQTNAMAGAIENILGESSKNYLDWARNGAEAFGISQRVAVQYGMTFSSLVAGFAKDTDTAANVTQALLKQSAVIASNTGRTLEDVVDRIRSGLLGNTEAIEDLAINVNVSAIEATEAFKRMADGKSWQQLDFNTQQAIRTQAILEQSMARYGTTLNPALEANLRLSASMENMKYQIGGALVPMINAIMPAIQKFVNALTTAMMYVRAFFEVIFGTGSSGASSGGSGGTAQAMGKVEQSSSNIAKNIDSATTAAKGLNRQLAGFDELNVLSEDSGSGTGGLFDGIGNISVPDIDLSGFDLATGALDGMADKFEMIKKKVQEFMEGPIGKLSAVLLASAAAFKLVSWAVGLTPPSLTALTAAFASAKAAVLAAAGSLAGIIAAAVAVIGVIYVFRDEIRSFVDKDWSKSWGKAGEIFNVFRDLILKMVDNVEETVDGMIKFVKGILSGDWAMAWEGAKQLASGAVAMMVDSFFGLPTAIQQAVAKMAELLKLGMDGIRAWIEDNFGPAWANAFDVITAPIYFVLDVVEAMSTGISGVMDSLAKTLKALAKGDWKGAWTEFKNIFKSIWNTLEGIAKAPINAILRMINGLINGVNGAMNALNKISIDVPDWIPVIGGKKFGFNIPKIPNVPLLADGGVPKQGQLFVANEAGPELVGNFGGRTGVVNNTQIVESIEKAVFRAMMASNSDKQTTIVMNGRKVGEELRKENAGYNRRTGMAY